MRDYSMPTSDKKLALIAGNGRFPLLVRDAARAAGFDVSAAMRPDWRLAKLLLSLTTRNTDSLLGAIAKVLADEGIALENSTSLLEPLLVKSGVLTRREPTEQERKNIEYGRAAARQLAEYDIGQTVVIAETACVAVEAVGGA